MQGMTHAAGSPPDLTLVLRFRPLRVELEDPATLRALRALRGMDQDDLASAMGVTRQNVSLWERGKVSLSVEDAVTLAGLLGVPARFSDDADAA